MNEPTIIQRLLRSKTIAVVGLSDNPQKPSNYVPAYLQSIGHRILPINPTIGEVLGEKSYASLADLPEKPDLVNVFRLPKFIPAIVDEMIALYAGKPNPPGLWLQQGITHPEATARAEAAGISVVADRCLMVESKKAAFSSSLLAISFS
jgi:predicted CoA-binding protein